MTTDIIQESYTRYKADSFDPHGFGMWPATYQADAFYTAPAAPAPECGTNVASWALDKAPAFRAWQWGFWRHQRVRHLRCQWGLQDKYTDFDAAHCKVVALEAHQELGGDTSLALINYGLWPLAALPANALANIITAAGGDQMKAAKWAVTLALSAGDPAMLAAAKAHIEWALTQIDGAQDVTFIEVFNEIFGWNGADPRSGKMGLAIAALGMLMPQDIAGVQATVRAALEAIVTARGFRLIPAQAAHCYYDMAKKDDGTAYLTRWYGGWQNVAVPVWANEAAVGSDVPNRVGELRRLYGDLSRRGVQRIYDHTTIPPTKRAWWSEDGGTMRLYDADFMRVLYGPSVPTHDAGAMVDDAYGRELRRLRTA